MNHENRISKLPNPILSKIFTFLKLKLATPTKIWSKKSQTNKDDRISTLPDAILRKILSFLDLKSAIRTSILSKTWKPIWTFLEDFDFDFEKYRRDLKKKEKSRRDTGPLNFRYTLQDALLQYVLIINEVLSNRDDTSKIGKFRLAFNVNVDPIFIQDWIHYAASHNVEELDLAAFHYPIPFRFPLNFLESRYLRKLRLKHYGGSMIIPKPFCFPNLKVLYLERFGFKDEDDFCFPNEPFSGFPNLEELTLDCCVVDGLMILASELKFLELQFRGYQPQFSSECKIFKVATPKLKSFMFQGQVSLICSMEELPCLDEVHLLLYPILESPYTDEVKQKMPTNLFKLLDQLKNTKTLALLFTTIEVLSMDSNALQQYPPPFVNLKHLIFFCKPWEKLSDVLNESIMAYLTSASVFSDSIIVENIEP